MILCSCSVWYFLAFLGALVLGLHLKKQLQLNNWWSRWSTALYLTAELAEHLLGSIAIAAYSYMALVPVIQPPIMKLLTTEKNEN